MNQIIFNLYPNSFIHSHKGWLLRALRGFRAFSPISETELLTMVLPWLKTSPKPLFVFKGP